MLRSQFTDSSDYHLQIQPINPNQETLESSLILYGLEDPISLFVNPEILNASHIKLVLHNCDQEKLKILHTLCRLNKNVSIELFSNQFQIILSELPVNIQSVSTLSFFSPLSESNTTWKEINTATHIYNFNKIMQKRTIHSQKSLYMNEIKSKFFHLLVQGLSYNEISEQLKMSINSVRYYIKELYKALNVNNKAAVILMYQNGEIIVHNDPTRRVKNFGAKK